MFYSRFKNDISAARKRISLSGIKIANTRLGKIEYTTFGEGLPVLWVHGIVGGADQGTLSSQQLIGKGFKIIAASRFGYLGSPLPKHSTPSAQADLYAALLDVLNISKVSIVGFSAGGPSALQFALRYPDRCLSLILVSGAVPPYKVPSGFIRFFAKIFFGSDFIFWSLIKYFTPLMMSIMGVPKSIQKNLTIADKKWLDDSMLSFLPVSLRINGIINDIWVTNPDLNKDYPYNELTVPTLIIHAVDDPMPYFTTAKRIAEQIPNSKFLAIESGGHLHIGHQSMVRTSMSEFITSTKKLWIHEPQTHNMSICNSRAGGKFNSQLILRSFSSGWRLIVKLQIISQRNIFNNAFVRTINEFPAFANTQTLAVIYLQSSKFSNDRFGRYQNM